MVLTNPFGRKSSYKVINVQGETEREDMSYLREDFWATTSNKQLNFLQHVRSLLTINGRAAIVVPDNVLFEGGVGETIRRKLLERCDVHALLRLPYRHLLRRWRQGQRAVLRPQAAAREALDEAAMIYDFRTNQSFTLKTRALVRADLDDFVACYNSANRHERTETERFKPFEFDDLTASDKASPDIFWLRDESLEDSDNLPAPEVIAAKIVEDLQAALEQFAAIASSLNTEGAA
jgi:type I restriction enzyme M protein